MSFLGENTSDHLCDFGPQEAQSIFLKGQLYFIKTKRFRGKWKMAAQQEDLSVSAWYPSQGNGATAAGGLGC